MPNIVKEIILPTATISWIKFFTYSGMHKSRINVAKLEVCPFSVYVSQGYLSEPRHQAERT